MYPRLKELREYHDLSQQQIAQIAECTQSAYSKYENGKLDVPVQVFIKLAKFYNVSTDYILGLTDKETL